MPSSNLGPALGKPIAEGLTLPIQLGNIAEQGPLDLQEARSRSQAFFRPENIENVLRNGAEENKIRKEVLDVIVKDEVFGDWKRKSLHLSREQVMELAHKACRRVFEVSQTKNWGEKHASLLTRNLELGSFLLHDVAFAPVIMSQGSDEQHERWAAKCLNKEILGCYLQTELGHGSNVQMLETLATYDAETETFDIHSPTMTSTKWWIGALGLTATHGVVQAQLVIKGKRFGPHLFFVPLRDMKTGKPFDGIVIGDIGPKAYAGYATTDNGWARFTHVRIPRANMLNRFSKVEKDGTYVKPPSSKLSYGGMVYIRATMIESSGWVLSKAATITLRYATVRRQFKSPSDPSSKELSVINYPHLHRRLLTTLANSYGFILAGKRMFELYLELSEQLKKGDVSMLADIHLATSSLKAYTSKYTIDGLEESRQMCGGHGFSAYSGFSQLFPTNAPSVTYEGENWVLMQQVGRGLLKRLSQLAASSTSGPPTLSGPTSFLNYIFTSSKSIPTEVDVDSWLNNSISSSFLQIRTALRLQYIRGELEQEGRKFEEISFECGELAKGYGELVIAIWFEESLKSLGPSFNCNNSVSLLRKLLSLSTLSALYRDLVPLSLTPLKGRGLPSQISAILTASSIQNLEKAIRSLTSELLPHAIGLSDAFGHEEWELNSSLGRRDGRVYESLMSLAEGNPMNHGSFRDEGNYSFGSQNVGKNVAQSWTSYIGPLLEENARKNGGSGIRGDGSKL